MGQISRNWSGRVALALRVPAAPDRGDILPAELAFFSAKTRSARIRNGSRALEQPSPRTAHAANLGVLYIKIKKT